MASIEFSKLSVTIKSLRIPARHARSPRRSLSRPLSCAVHPFPSSLCKCHRIIAGPLRRRCGGLLRAPVGKTAQPETPLSAVQFASCRLLPFFVFAFFFFSDNKGEK